MGWGRLFYRECVQGRPFSADDVWTETEWGDEDVTGRSFRKKFQVEEMVEIKANRWESVWYIWVLEI